MRTKWIGAVLGIAVAVLLLAAPVMAQEGGKGEVIEKVGKTGELNWSDETLIARGIGGVNPDVPASAQRAGAIRAAKADAFRNLLEILEGVHIDSETTVENQITKSDVIRTKVQGIIQGAHVSKTKYMSDGSVEVEMSIAIVGELLDELLPEEPDATPISAAEAEPTGAEGEEKTGAPSGAKTPAPAAVYTSLIVDARGLGLKPALAPQVLDEAGREVYGMGFASDKVAAENGVVEYEDDLAFAKKNELAGRQPFVVKALRAAGTAKTDPVISTAEAIALHSSKGNLEMLKNCRVIFVTDY